MTDEEYARVMYQAGAIDARQGKPMKYEDEEYYAMGYAVVWTAISKENS